LSSSSSGRFRQRFFANFGLKVMALIVAVLVWLVVTMSEQVK